MYSMLLMAAMSTGPQTQAWHHGGHCYGGYAAPNLCWYGGGCYGCSAWGPYTSGSYGYGCAYGWAGYGLGYGSGYYGFPTFQCHGCYGCYAGWSCYGMPIQGAVIEGPVAPSVVSPPPPAKKSGKVEETPPPREEKKKGSEEQARARVIIEVPADAKVYVDGQLTRPGSNRRVFQTPELAPGRTYYYDVRAEVMRDGRVVSSNQRLIVRPGETATANFAGMEVPRDAAARSDEQ